MIRLGVNIDHVATVRNARGETYPDPVQAALMCELAGADNITCHLREDRRHIRDRDVKVLKETIGIPLNFEMAATSEMVLFASQIKPHSVTLVPERREERTTEGGLDLQSFKKDLTEITARLKGEGILVSLFVEPDAKAVALSREIGAQAVEFHTGAFCHRMALTRRTQEQWLLVDGLKNVAKVAHEEGLQAHFGHGLNFTNASWLQHIDYAEEANIGHAIIGRAIFVGLVGAVTEMKRLLNDPSLRPYAGS